jgi:parallel beta-helix repeat protein
MNKRLTSVAVVCFLVTAGLMGFITLESNVVGAGVTWYVGSGPGNDSLTIYGGIALASDGDTVFVYGGTYVENVMVDKTINLTGEDRNSTIIDGGGLWDSVIIIKNYVNVTGFTVTGSGDAGFPGKDAGIELERVQNCSIVDNNIIFNGGQGIYLYGACGNNILRNNIISNGFNGILLESDSKSDSNHNIVSDNIATNNSDGIAIFSCGYNIVTNNNASNNTDAGISTHSSDNTLITNNIVLSNRYGIHLVDSCNSTILNCTMLEDGICVMGEYLDMWNTHSIDTSNTVNTKPVYYWKNQTGGKIPPDAGQVILANCTNVGIENLNISNTSAGIQLGFSD